MKDIKLAKRLPTSREEKDLSYEGTQRSRIMAVLVRNPVSVRRTGGEDSSSGYLLNNAVFARVFRIIISLIRRSRAEQIYWNEICLFELNRKESILLQG
jgi:hypothetical protein